MFERTRAALALLLAPKSFDLFPGVSQGILQGFFPTRSTPRKGTTQVLQAYSRLPWLHVSVKKIAEHTASARWKLFVRVVNGKVVESFEIQRCHDYEDRRRMMRKLADAGELREVPPRHPFLELQRRGNPRIRGWQSRFVTQATIDLTGEAFWMLERNGAGRPFFYWPIPPHWIRQLPQPGHPFFDISFGTLHKQVPVADMVWLKMPDPLNPYARGAGTGVALADELDIDEATAKYVKGFFENDATPSLMIGLQGASEDQMHRAERKFNEHGRGFFKRFRAHFSRTKLDVKQLSQNLGDLGVTELRQQQRDTTHQGYGIPPEIIGIVENSNRATIDAAKTIFGEQVLLPRLTFERDEWQPIAEEFDERLILDFESPVPENRDFRLSAMKAQPAAPEINEWREMQGLLPDEKLAGKHFVPAAILTQELDGSEPVPEEDEDDSKGALVQLPLNPAWAKQQQLALVDNKQISGSDIELLLNSLDPAVIGAAVDPVFQELVQTWAADILRDLGVDVAFNLLNPRVVNFLAEQSSTRITRINEVTRSRIRRQLTQGVTEGESVQDIGRRVRGFFRKNAGARALQIARTEVLGASNFGSLEGMRQSGVVDDKRWLTTLDGEARDTHIDLHGQVRGVSEPFTSSGGGTAQHPGGFGIAEEDINCRCAVSPVIRDSERTATELANEWKVFDRRLRPWEARVRQAFVRGFNEQMNELLRRIQALSEAA